MEPCNTGSRGHPLARALVYLLLILVVSLAVGLLAGALGGVLGGVGLGLGPTAMPSTLTPFDLLVSVIVLAPAQLALTHAFLRRVDRSGWREVFGAWQPPGEWTHAATAAGADAATVAGAATSAGAATEAGQTQARGREQAGVQFAIGWGLATGILGLLLLTGAGAGWVRLVGLGPATRSGWMHGTAAAAAALFAAFLQGGTEEVIFRGYVMRNLAQWRGLPAAVAGSALLFGIVHGMNPDAGPVALLNVGLIGVFLGLLRAHFTLWAAVGLHSGWNTLLILLSMPCSGFHFDGLLATEVSGPTLWTGGGFGVEASLLATITFTAGVAILALSRAGGRGRPAGGHGR